jgi:hypothetical protein
VAYNGSGSAPFAVYDTSSYTGWLQVYGTSAGAPQWAALVAIADQGRVAAGLGTLDGLTQTLPRLYQLPQSDFHDITGGTNGAYSGGAGYDLVTGRGTPCADLIAAGLVGTSTAQPPTVVAPASANLNPVTGTATSLSVLGGDATGESSLTYTWTVTSQPVGVTPPRFSSNLTNAAKNTTATFKAAGAYTFQVTITDPAGLTATSSVAVTVQQTLTGLAVSPGTANLAAGATQQFSAAESDQFGNPMGAPVTCTWSLTGIGTVSSTGLYTAPASSGTATLNATAGGLSGAASVTIATLPAAPVLSAAAVSGHQVNLSWVESTTNVTGFIIQRSTNGSSWTQVASVGGTVTSYSDTGVSRKKVYYYRVCACNGLGNSPWSTVAKVVTPSAGIAAGTGLALMAAGSESTPSITPVVALGAGSRAGILTDQPLAAADSAGAPAFNPGTWGAVPQGEGRIAPVAAPELLSPSAPGAVGLGSLLSDAADSAGGFWCDFNQGTGGPY